MLEIYSHSHRDVKHELPVTWPKPMAEQIYAFFNAYDDKHPWVSGESIRPKAVARDMVEGYRAFADYVKELGIERSEGVLLRYLTEVYKALVQNVPERLRTDAVLDVIAYLRALLGRVDSSLITEWETLLLGGDAPQADAAPRPVDISLDKRAFAARVRAELHLLVRALSLQDWEEAAASLRQDDDSPWTPETIQAAVQPFLDELGPVAFDHRARQPLHTRITPAGPHQWTVRQALLPQVGSVYGDADATGFEEADPDEAVAWAIEGRIDLRADTNPAGPLVELLAIGE